MDRYLAACHAAERIINMIECAGFDLTDPYSIINCGDIPEGMDYAYGASRLVIWDNDYCDYVIKIALNSDYEKYCQHEVEVYKAAAKEGFADKFAWCACYAEPTYADGKVDAPGIYIMEYMYCNADEAYDSAWKYGYETYCEARGLDSSNYDYVIDFDNWNCEDDEEMIIDCVVSGMSDSEKKAFYVFMNKWWITDIHQGNVSVTDNGLVITDYAGWNW